MSTPPQPPSSEAQDMPLSGSEQRQSAASQSSSGSAPQNPLNLGPDSPQIQDLASRLYDAARTGNVATFEAALPAGLPPNMTNSAGQTLLMLASYHGHVALSKLLLSYGADPNRLNDRGQSPLAGTLFKGEDEIAQLLLDAGADVDAGQPSAWDCLALFRKDESWKERFERQRERLRGKVEGVGGTKEGVEMV